MAWHDDPNHPFAGIAEKLKRANENIVNLNSEIELFIQSGQYPTLPDPNSEMWKEAVAYHKAKLIPLRFAVLTGEIVHHLRSCLDHVVWHFSDADSRTHDPNGIEFPIFEEKPGNHDERKKYKRKIQGIANAKVLSLIEASQPYHAGADVADHLLLIVHNMDRFDKHRELMIVDSSAIARIPPTIIELQDKVRLYEAGKLPKSEHATLINAAHKHGKVTPGIAFRQFGKRENYSLLRGVFELLTAVEKCIDSFAVEI